MIARISVFRQASVTITSLALTLVLALGLSLGTSKAVATDQIIIAQAFPGQGQYHMPPAFDDGDEDDIPPITQGAEAPGADNMDQFTGTDDRQAPPTAPQQSQAAAQNHATAHDPQPRQAPEAPAAGEYVLGVGDKVAVDVYGEPDLSGEFEIDGAGRIFMPLIGTVNLAGHTIPSAHRAIINILTPDYLKDPKVNIAVTNFRDYYILGEVNSPGAKPYKSGLTVINAIALSGGYTGRASKEKITVVRADDSNQEEVRIGLDDLVQPGDILRIKQRLF